MIRILLLSAAIYPAMLLAAFAEPYEATITTNTESGTVKYELPGTTSYKDLAWKDTVKVPAGTLIMTTSEGVGMVEIFPGGRIFVLPNSSFKVAALSVDTAGDAITKRQARINLTSGTLKALLSHKGGNTSPIDFSIKTPEGVAAARGTTYVTSVIDNITYVYVISGTVDVNGTLVNPGQVAEVGPDGKVFLINFASLPESLQNILNEAVQTTMSGTPTVNASDASGSAHAN